MASKPAFSIVIPVYNREREIGRAIESCLSQTGADFEVIVVDDASQDRSAEIAAGYERVQLIRHPVNLGSSPARTTGIRAAQGDWIVRLDSDDELVVGALATLQRTAAQVPDRVGRIGLMYRYDDGRISPFPAPNGEVLSYEDLLAWLENTEMHDILNVFRRSAIEAVPLPEGRLMEMIHNLDIARRFDTLWLPEVGLLYHTDAGGRQSKDLPSPEESLQNVEEVRQIVERHGDALRRIAPRFLETQLRRMTVSMALGGDREGAMREGLRQLKSSMFSPLNWAAVGFVAMGRRPLAKALDVKWQLVEWRRKRMCRAQTQS